jgi:hypothetical protein
MVGGAVIVIHVEVTRQWRHWLRLSAAATIDEINATITHLAALA